MARLSARVAAVSICLPMLAGCMCSSAPSRVSPPNISPSGAASAAIKLYDKNNDGRLDAEELKAVPSIAGALSRFDGDGDGAVSQSEIADRLNQWLSSRVGLMSFNAQVTLDGRPFSGAEVLFEPEPFLADAIKPARGTTDANGMVVLSVAPEDLPSDQRDLTGVMQPGLYKVRVTHPQTNVPARFNTETTLGQEVAQGATDGEPIVFEVRSR